MASELIFFNMCRIVAGRGTANFKAKFPVLQELFAKNHRRYKDDKSLNSGQIPILNQLQYCEPDPPGNIHNA